MNKRGIVPRFLVEVIIATILVAIIYLVVSNIYNYYQTSTYDSQAGFNSLIAKIQEVNSNEQESYSSVLNKEILAKESGLLLFTENKDKIELNGTWSSFIKRPDECKIDQPCICLCKKFQSTTYIDPNYAEFNCFNGFYYCTNLDMKFYPSPAGEEIGYYTFPSKFDNGFYLKSEKVTTKYIPSTEERTQWTIEKYKGYLIFCIKKQGSSTCFSEQSKKIINIKKETVNDLNSIYEFCKTAQIPNNNNSCVCGKYNMNLIPQDYTISFENTPEAKNYEILDENNNPIAKGDFSGPLRRLKIDDEQNLLNQMTGYQISINSDAFLFDDLGNPSLAFLKYKENENEYITLGFHTYQYGWKFVRNNIIRITREIQDLKEIPACEQG